MSATTEMTAAGATAGYPALLADSCGDQTSLFRIGRNKQGIAEWSAGRQKADDLRRHSAINGTPASRIHNLYGRYMRVIVWVAAPVGMALCYLPRLVGGRNRVGMRWGQRCFSR